MRLVPSFSTLRLRLLHALDFREQLDVPSWFSKNIRAQLDYRAIRELCELYAESAEPLMSMHQLLVLVWLMSASFSQIQLQMADSGENVGFQSG